MWKGENNIMEYFWKKKTIVSYLLSVFVFLIHISSLSNYKNSGGFISVVNNFLEIFFKRTITSYAVVLFFIISGVLFFRNYDKTMYFDKIKSRIKTLAIPFLIWNVIWMFFEIVTSYTFLSSYFIGREKFEITVSNVLNAIFHYGCNGPFWFIFELFFFVIITPIIDKIIKNKYIGFSVALVILILSQFDIGLPSPLFYSKEAISYYILGGIIGKHFWEKFSMKSSGKIQWISVIGVIICTIYTYFRISLQFEILILIHKILNLSYAFFFWYSMDMFIDKMRMYEFYSHSFAVFAMHVNVSAIVSKLYYIILPKTPHFAIINFVLTIASTLLIINIFCLLLRRFFPKLNAILMGMR